MARPITNGGNERRELIVPVRFSVDEKSKLDKLWKASGIKYLSDYLRKKMLGAEAVQMQFMPERETFIRVLSHLGKVGSNLNQIAKVLNRRELTGEKLDISAERIIQTLDAIDKLVNYLMEIVRKHGHNRKSTR